MASFILLDAFFFFEKIKYSKTKNQGMAKGKTRKSKMRIMIDKVREYTQKL